MKYSLYFGYKFDNDQLIYTALNQTINRDEDILLVGQKANRFFDTMIIPLCERLGIKVEKVLKPDEVSDITIYFDGEMGTFETIKNRPNENIRS